MNQKNLIIISDYGVGDPAFAEVSVRLLSLIPNLTILPVSTPSFSTINTGFWISQIALTPEISDTLIYSNTAPRKTDKKAQKNNRGESLMYSRLENGFEIIAVNSGFCFSFVKTFIKDFRTINVSNEGSQFRSRDNYPKIVARAISGNLDFLGNKFPTKLIPDIPKNKIASIDGYGNIKTTTRISKVKLKPGQKVLISLNNKKHQATFSDGVFNISEGETAYAPGSSGYGDRFMEIFVRGGSASDLFGKPKVEEDLELLEI